MTYKKMEKRAKNLITNILVSMFFILILAGFVIAALDVTITGEINSLDDPFTFKTNDNSVWGKDVYDINEPPAPPSGSYAQLYSEIYDGDNYDLTLDSWNYNGTVREIDLAFKMSAAQTGTINFSWPLVADEGDIVNFIYYDDDSTYTTAVRSVSMIDSPNYTADVVSEDLVYMRVQTGQFSSSISAPLNTTYVYQYNNSGNHYLIDLDVSVNMLADTIWFSHINHTGGVDIINQTIGSGTTSVSYEFNATRFQNRVIVYANDSSGNVVSSEIYFYIALYGREPEIVNLNDTYYVCEDTSLNEYFQVENYNGNTLEFTDEIPNAWLSPESSTNERPNINLYSGTFLEIHLAGDRGFKTFNGNISVAENDSLGGSNQTTSQSVNITLIEINDAPVLDNIPSPITLILQGDYTYDYTLSVNDEETGSGSNLNYTIGFTNGENLFTINSTGSMYYVADSDDLASGNPKTYNATICVQDDAIPTCSQNISLCSGICSYETSCDTLNITVTNSNDPPTIDSFSPSDTNPTLTGISSLSFTVTATDPQGTSPTVYWYFNNIYQTNEVVDGNDNSTFNSAVSCGTSGSDVNIAAIASDGDLNSSFVNWTVDYTALACPPENNPGSSSGGGGGGGGAPPIIGNCTELWGSETWTECFNTKSAYDEGLIDIETKLILDEKCFTLSWDEEYCGYQTRNVIDFNVCGTEDNKPAELRECHYSLNPNCKDKVKNCHDGYCEVGIDCGGPCDNCATCNDGIQNQDEEGIDCGGPCKNCDGTQELPKDLIKNLIFLFAALIFLAAMVVIVLFTIKYYRSNKQLELEKEVRYEKID
jgi:hypothetical protein